VKVAASVLLSLGEFSMSTLIPEKSQDPVGDKNVDASTAPVPLDCYFNVDNKTRELIHTKLRAYEARRRSAYAAKLESSSLYWRSFRDLLASSVHETGRAERLVLGTARANATYADAMKASYDDTLIDERGQLVLDPKKRSKLLQVRSEQDYALAPVSQQQKDKIKRSPAFMEERRSNMLSSLIDSQKVVAENFEKNSKELESEIANELTQLRVELESKIQAIREIGDAIIAELEATDAEVCKAWGTSFILKFVSEFHSLLPSIITFSHWSVLIMPTFKIHTILWLSKHFREKEILLSNRVLMGTQATKNTWKFLMTAWMSG
jgi:hypothetical protein